MSSEIVRAAWLGLPVENGYRAREDRGVIRALRSWEGIEGYHDLIVTPTSPASMQSYVGPGRIIVDGDQDPDAQGSYVFSPPDWKLVTHAPADGVNPRWDLVGVQVWDDDFDGSGLLDCDRVVIKGNPAADPVVPDPPGTAAWYPLNKVWVGAGVGSLVPGNYVDLRERNDMRTFYSKIHQPPFQSIPDSFWTWLTGMVPDSDPAGMATSDSIWVPVSGWYLIEYRVSLNWPGGTYWLGGAVFSSQTYMLAQDLRKYDASWPFVGIAGGFVMRWLSKGTQVNVSEWHSGGTAVNTANDGEGEWPLLSVTLIGA